MNLLSFLAKISQNEGLLCILHRIINSPLDSCLYNSDVYIIDMTIPSALRHSYHQYHHSSFACEDYFHHWKMEQM